MWRRFMKIEDLDEEDNEDLDEEKKEDEEGEEDGD